MCVNFRQNAKIMGSKIHIFISKTSLHWDGVLVLFGLFLIGIVLGFWLTHKDPILHLLVCISDRQITQDCKQWFSSLYQSSHTRLQWSSSLYHSNHLYLALCCNRPPRPQCRTFHKCRSHPPALSIRIHSVKQKHWTAFTILPMFSCSSVYFYIYIEIDRKTTKDCECCPVSRIIVRSQRLSWIQAISPGLSL